MGEIIGRAVSRKMALQTLDKAQQHIPEDRVAAYVAALNRVRYEFGRHDPVKPVDGHCGKCGMPLQEEDLYCWNCGKEVDKQCKGDNYEYTETYEN